VLAISIGEAAKFFISDGFLGKRTRILVESGDAVMFNGGQYHHGIEEVIEGSAPSFWYDSELFSGMSRFNIQFRDSSHDKLNYDPQFSSEQEEYMKRSKDGSIH